MVANAERGGSILLERNGQFADYLHRQKLSESTLRTYPAAAAAFHAWAQDAYDNQLPRQLYRDHVLAYRDYLVSCRVKPQTINHKLSALRKYNAYLIAHKHQRGEVFKRGDFLRIRPKKPQACGIPDTPIRAFLECVRKTGYPRDVALVTLLACTGMKLQEALGLRTGDVDWQQGQVTVNARDKKKERTLPLHEQALAALQVYWEVRRTRYPQAHTSARGGRRGRERRRRHLASVLGRLVDAQGSGDTDASAQPRKESR